MQKMGAAGTGALALLAFCGVGTAEAGIIPLGSFSGPATASIGDAGLDGPFADDFTFTIAPGAPLLFSASLSTGFTNFLFDIPDLAGMLLDGATPVEAGTATTTHRPEGFPSFNLAFDPVALGPGNYSLDVTGTAIPAFPGPTAGFDGAITLAAAPVIMAEPASLSLLLTGLAALASGLLARRFLSTPR